MLGQNLYNLRKSNSMNQEDLAKILNVSRQAISKWERDESEPDLEKLLVLSKIFGVTVDELLDESFDSESYQIPNKNMFAMFDYDSQKLISLGAMIIAIISAGVSLYGLLTMYKFGLLGAPIDIEATGLFQYILKDFKVILLMFHISNIILVSSAVVIYYLFKDNQINKHVRFGIMLFGVILILFSQTLFGLLYLFLGVISTQNNETVNIKKNSLRILLVIITYLILAGIIYYVIDIPNWGVGAF